MNYETFHDGTIKSIVEPVIQGRLPISTKKINVGHESSSQGHPEKGFLVQISTQRAH